MSEWDGRPPGEAATRDGWHWLTAWNGGEGWETRMPWCAKWRADRQVWAEVEPDECGEMLDREPAFMACGHHYLGPCLLPAEVAALVAAARREALEEAACWHEEQAARWRSCDPAHGAHIRHKAHASAIRALIGGDDAAA